MKARRLLRAQRRDPRVLARQLEHRAFGNLPETGFGFYLAEIDPCQWPIIVNVNP